MIELIYQRDGITDLRIFKDEDEYREWLKREEKLCPDFEIIEKKET